MLMNIRQSDEPAGVMSGLDAGSPLAEDHAQESLLDKACKQLCRVALAVMVVIINLEIVTRNIFGFSLNISDEYSSYMLIAITFFSLPLCIVHGSLHRVTFVLDRVPDRWRTMLLVVFDLIAMVVVAVILVQVVWLVVGSRQLHTTAPTMLQTPVWIPQLAMPVGAAALLVGLCRAAIRHARRPARRDQP